MAKFDTRGNLEGRLSVVALWLNTKGGLDGRINAIVKHGSEYLVGDLACALKFGWGNHDSLRRGWEYSTQTRTFLHDKLSKQLSSARNGRCSEVISSELPSVIRDLTRAISDDDYLCHYLYMLTKSRTAVATRVWDKPHPCYWGLTTLSMFKQGQVPSLIQDLIKKLGAIQLEQCQEFKAAQEQNKAAEIAVLEKQIAKLRGSKTTEPKLKALA